MNLVLNVPKYPDQLVSKTHKFKNWVCTQTENNTPGISMVVKRQDHPLDAMVDLSDIFLTQL